MAGHQIRLLRHESRLKVGLVSVFTVGLWVGALGISLGAFSWLQEFGDETLGPAGLSLGSLISARLLSTFAMTLFLLLIFSNILVTYATLYRAHDLKLLVTSPIGWRSLFLARFVEALTLSSWGSFFLGSPLLIAFGQASEAPWSFYPMLLLAFVPLAILAAALGAGVTLGLVRFGARFGRGPWFLIGGLAIAGTFAVLRNRFGVLDPGQGASLGTLLALLEQTERPWIPSQWAVEAVLASARGEAGRGLLSLLTLGATAAGVLALVTEGAARFFYPGWSGLQGSGRKAEGGPSKIFDWADVLTSPLPEPSRSLFRKDLRLFWRDAAQWSQFLIFFGLMALYLSNMKRSSPAYEAELWQSLITGLNGVVCLLILATLTTRFIFPMISLEGRRVWILGLAPITWRQVLRQKLWLSLACTSVFTLGLAILSSLRLQLGLRPFLLTLVTVAVATVALSGLAVGLGAVFADFQEDNSSRIVSGMGGTLNFILSLAFVLIAATLQTALLQWSWVSRWGGLDLDQGAATAIGLGMLLLAGALATWLPLHFGLRSLERAEF